MREYNAHITAGEPDDPDQKAEYQTDMELLHDKPEIVNMSDTSNSGGGNSAQSNKAMVAGANCNESEVATASSEEDGCGGNGNGRSEQSRAVNRNAVAPAASTFCPSRLTFLLDFICCAHALSSSLWSLLLLQTM